MPGYMSGVGVPNLRKILSNCVPSSPGNNGFPVLISAKMHPMLQTSTGVEYLCGAKKVKVQHSPLCRNGTKRSELTYLRDPNNTSGARYHSVTTS